MTTDRTAPSPSITRRSVLLRGLALAATTLAGCGGGGGGGGGVAPAPDGKAASGRLVYRNSGVAAVYDFASARETTFNPGENLGFDPGVTVSRSGIVSVSRGEDNDGFDFALYGLDGRERSVHRVARELAFQTSPVMFNADDTRIAFSVDEPVSASVGDRIARTLVVQWPSGTVVASLDGYEEPVWAGPHGELIVRHAETLRLRLFDAALNDRGAVADLVASTFIGAYNVSPDGRLLVYEDGSEIRVHDRDTGQRWVAARDATSATHAPNVSPDGRHLAFFARDMFNVVPHVVPFAAGTTVQVDSALHALDTIADCRARFGWAA